MGRDQTNSERPAQQAWGRCDRHGNGDSGGCDERPVYIVAKASTPDKEFVVCEHDIVETAESYALDHVVRIGGSRDLVEVEMTSAQEPPPVRSSLVIPGLLWDMMTTPEQMLGEAVDNLIERCKISDQPPQSWDLSITVDRSN